MIIGLTGKKQSGKDTVAAYLIKQHNFERRAFADPLKKSVAALLDIPFHKIDQYKNDSSIRVELAEYAEGTRDPHIAFVSSFTFREFLQRYGTESHRDVFGVDFWLDYTLPVDGFYSGRNIVLTDVRFESEVNRVSRIGGFVVEIVRPGLESQDPHSSEQPLHPKLINYQILNDSSIEDLYEVIEDMLVELGDKQQQIA